MQTLKQSQQRWMLNIHNQPHRLVAYVLWLTDRLVLFEPKEKVRKHA